jgi:ABC-type antimicrobial peptide transport system permease subunit
MRAMRGILPIFIFVGLALMAVIGIVIFQSSATAAVVEVNDTSKEELPLTIFDAEYAVIFGIASILMILAGYFALRTMMH